MTGSSQVVALRCGAASFAIPIDKVREIVMVPDITPVPDSGPYVLGIISLRGRILPVIDLALRLALGPGPRERTGRILVVEQDGQHLVGLLVDDAAEVLRIPEGTFGPPPELAAGSGAGAIARVARLDDRLLLLLDLDRVLSREQLGALPEPGRELPGN
jgi:purine-binding chemotaxis protein CheW